jgi:hypothetical protein
VLPLALVFAGIAWLLAQTFVTQNVANAANDRDEAHRKFELLSGFTPPEGQRGGTLGTLAGWQVVMLEERAADEPPSPELELSVWAFHQGSLAGTSTPEELLDKVERTLELQMSLQGDDPALAGTGATPTWWRLGERKASLRGSPVIMRTLALGAERGGQRFEGARIAASAFTSPHGRPMLLIVMGPTTRVTSVQRAFVLRMGS